jgi:hypothetical protein
MKRSMAQVKQAALDNAPALLLAKTTGFFDNMCCATYLREQVAAEPIELDFDGDDNSIVEPAFMWMDIDESGAEECKSEGEWTDEEVEDCGSDCEVFSRSPDRKIKILESERTPAPPPYYLTKSPSRSHSTATTVTENSCITNHSWETQLSLSLPDPASDESVVPKSKAIRLRKSSAPRMISVPSFKLKKRPSSIDYFPYPLGSSMSMPDM